MRGLIDIHTHILPGLDDGAAGYKTVAEMLKVQARQGVTHIIATPHYRRGMFEPNMGRILDAYDKVSELARAQGIQLYLGCEIHYCFQMAEVMERKSLPSLAGSRYVLVEYSGNTDYHSMKENIYHLRSNGYWPVIAHVERYECLRQKETRIKELIELGAKMQVNAESLLGRCGLRTKMFCKRLIRRDQLTYLASDTHGIMRRPPMLGDCASYLSRKYGTEYARRILIENPEKIIRGE